jgi:branched-chain amino acid transport system ATP-binding protein
VALLELEDVTRTFGGVVALDHVSMAVSEGEIAGLIGPNGAGKTTAFNVVTRLYSPDHGRLVFDGQDLLGVPAHAVVRRGIARTFQNLALFHDMTVLDNVLVGAHARIRRGAEKSTRAEAHEALAYLDLEDLAGRLASGLPFGVLKRVETARALMARPRLLLLDEPAGGLNHEEVEDLVGLIGRMRDDYELTIVLVEHHMNLVMRVSEQVHVLNFGRMIASGTPDEVRADPAVVEAYLGTGDGDGDADGNDGAA